MLQNIAQWYHWSCYLYIILQIISWKPETINELYKGMASRSFEFGAKLWDRKSFLFLWGMTYEGICYVAYFDTVRCLLGYALAFVYLRFSYDFILWVFRIFICGSCSDCVCKCMDYLKFACVNLCFVMFKIDLSR